MYPFKDIEKKWTKKWLETGVYEPNLKTAKRPFYNLMMFPYPSAEGLHVGNVYAFTGSDVYGRYERMQGFDVFEPIGLDGFGIHSENYALKIGTHPMRQSKISEKNFYRQLQMIGNGFAWNERLETYDPDYYKWTQWIFIQMFKNGLAYRKKSSVNWCPSCKTVLADEQVIDGECERCNTEVTKKDLEQWFFKITKYADRLLKNLDKIDWPEHIKTAQRNWIGRSGGSELVFSIKDSKEKIEVFTTRPDTIYGVTYMVLAPEHPLVHALREKITNWNTVHGYIKKASAKTENERIREGKSKTGVALKGVVAINPATKKEIPIWIADYVLGSYGTGAIMAVPAHDERDYEFATKNGLEVKTVIEPIFVDTKKPSAVKEGKPFVEREAIMAIVKHWKDDKYIGLKWKKVDWETIITGGVERDQSPEEAATEEIREETGYLHPKFIKELPRAHSKFFHNPKNVNRFAHFHSFYFELEDEEREEMSSEEKEIHDVVWVTRKEMENFRLPECHRFAWESLVGEKNVYIGEGVMVNSGKFDGLETEEAKWKIIKEVGGKKQTQYHLRDWIISRQRYWGPPIPMIHCEKCGWQPVPDKDLPVILPYIKDFQPRGKGEAPLATSKAFYEVKCPTCDGSARRETDVSDTFLDSAWYFLRYPDVKNKKEAFGKEVTKKWQPIDMYIGGAEHAVLHLLYMRFLTMALKDMEILDFEEPAPQLRVHGLLIKEGAKMSKSKGNVVNPDEYVNKFGADSLRMYLMFLGPLQDGGDWRDAGIMGVVRFLNRVWVMGKKSEEFKNGKAISGWLHSSIKKITGDISVLKYNTAIAELMTILNRLERQETVNKKDFEVFLLMLAPLAPFITEELWQALARTNSEGSAEKRGSGQRKSAFKSIHKQSWPKYDKKYLVENTITLVVQINGRLRATIEVKKGVTQKDAEKLALKNPAIERHLDSKKIKKTVFVKDRLINFVA